MSFDLGVWHNDNGLSVQEAGDLCVKLRKQTWVPTEEHPAVGRLLPGVVSSLYPEIDTFPDLVDNCTWSCAHDRSGLHVLVAITYGQRTAPVAQFAVEMLRSTASSVTIRKSRPCICRPLTDRSDHDSESGDLSKHGRLAIDRPDLLRTQRGHWQPTEPAG